MLDNPSCSPAKLARLGLRRLRLFESFREIAVEIARRIDPFAKRSSQLFWLLVIIALPISPACFGVTRHYYIAAEDVAWDYAPSGRDLLASRAIPEPWGGHTKCQKTRYFQYTDSTFSTRQPQPEWLGILGPIIRAEVGDEIIVDFWNRSGTPHSIHPRGVYYDKNSEGAFYLPWGGGARITHNRKFTYRWFAKSGSGPRPGQLSSVVWWYHSEVDETEETNAGLLGPIIITAKGMARVDGTPKDVDREFVVACVTFRQLEDKSEWQFHAINGYIFGNLLGLVMKQGEKVRWYVMGIGNGAEIPTPHWHGEILTDGRRNLDGLELLPSSTATLDMLAENPGTWMLHCQIADPLEAGMSASYTIYQPPRGTCPLQFVAGTFWGDIPSYTLAVKNVSHETITSFVVQYEQFLGPGYLVVPFNNEWRSTGPLSPGAQQTLTIKSYREGGNSILGWAVFPSRVLYANNTTWTEQRANECFEVFWKDQDHPQLAILPPEQIPMKDDD